MDGQSICQAAVTEFPTRKSRRWTNFRWISLLLDSIARRMKKWMIGAVFVQSSQPQPSALLRDTPTILVACVWELVDLNSFCQATAVWVKRGVAPNEFFNDNGSCNSRDLE